MRREERRQSIRKFYGEGERLTYRELFYKPLTKGKYSNSIKGFPITQGGWCRHLKYEEADISRFILQSHSATEKIGGGTSSRIPNTEGELVYKLPQVHREGKIYGFPYAANMGGWCRQLKTESMDSQYQYIKEIGVRDSKFSDASSRAKEDVKIKIVQYLGIAADEPKRIEKHASRPNVMLPLVMANMTEADCRKWCEENDLLSPIYTTATRGGCWFCHNQGIGQLRQLRHNYPNLWKKLLDIDLDSPTTFHADGRTVHDFEKRFQAEDDGYISADDRFRWDMLDNMQVTFDVIGKEKK